MHRLAAISLLASRLLTVSAFAQSLADIPPAYVPEASYKQLKCEELALKTARAENDLGGLFVQLQTYRSRYFVDCLALGLPLTTMGGNTVAAETYLEHNISHIIGELEALASASEHKSCSVGQRKIQP